MPGSGLEPVARPQPHGGISLEGLIYVINNTDLSHYISNITQVISQIIIEYIKVLNFTTEQTLYTLPVLTTNTTYCMLIILQKLFVKSRKTKHSPYKSMTKDIIANAVEKGDSSFLMYNHPQRNQSDMIENIITDELAML